jgi:Ca2+-transporting ATPase
LVVRGHGRAEVTAVGADTAVGQIGASLRSLHSPPTPMQLEIRRAVILFAALGLGSSLMMTLLYVAVHGGWLQALLAGITLAMANIPEEFPVVLTVFLPWAPGAWPGAAHWYVVRRHRGIGSVTVLCTDKTGTLTRTACRWSNWAPMGHAAASAALPPALRALLDCADLASPEQPSIRWSAPFEPPPRSWPTAVARGLATHP